MRSILSSLRQRNKLKEVLVNVCRMAWPLAISVGFLLCASSFAGPSPQTGQITFSWSYDFVANPNVTNFVIYYGTAVGNYTSQVNAGTNLTFTVTNLIRNQTYFAAATAQANTGLESDFSVEASKAVPPKPPKPLTFVAQ